MFRGLEDTLLDEICSRLKAADQLNEVTVLSIKALRSHGISEKEIKKAIKSVTNISEKKLNQLLDDVVARNQFYYENLIDLAHITQPETLVSIEDTWAIYEQTKQTMRNLTRSMGFLVDAGRTMLPPARVYQWALDNATMQIQSGAINYNQAIKSAVQQLAQSGLKVVDYESGHRDQIDVAARRAVMSGVNALNQKYAEQSTDYLETDLVETSAHIGARNTGVGPMNHESWQGLWFRWSEKPRTSEGNYPDFIATTGYGTGEGLGGWNCRHTFTPVVEGVSEPTYSQSDLDAMKGENRKFVFEGKEYDGYSATQQQRKIERTIRKLKREKAAYKAAGLTGEEQAVNIRLRRLNAKYKAFSAAAGLPEQRERARVYYLDNATRKGDSVKSAIAKKNPASTQPQYKQSSQNEAHYVDVTKNWREEATPNSHEVQDLQEYTKDGVTYKVDGHNVVLDYSQNEKEVAELLEKEFGGEIYMVPRVNNPQGISTPDYLFRGTGYDLKTIANGAGENTIFNRIKKAIKQADCFVVDVTASGLSDDLVNKQIDKLFSRPDTNWVKTIIIVKDRAVTRVVKRT